MGKKIPEMKMGLSLKDQSLKTRLQWLGVTILDILKIFGKYEIQQSLITDKYV